MYYGVMKWLASRNILILIGILYLSQVAASEVSRSPSFDLLDPRLPQHDLSLLYRLQISSGEFGDPNFDILNLPEQTGFNKQILNYLRRAKPYRIKFAGDDFRIAAGFRFKEDWLGFTEDDIQYASLHSSITLSGKIIIKDKLEIYHDLTIFRGDSSVNLENASTTGEYLVDPLLSFNYSHRGAIASDFDVFELQTDRAIIKTELFGIGIQTGRNRVQLKRGYRAGLMLSGLTRPVDMIYRLDYNFWRFGFTALTGQLTEAGPFVDKSNRYISVKRATFNLAHNLQVGLTEAVTYDNDPTAYINPIMLFYIVHRHRSDNDDNLIASFDFSYTPITNLNIYGELLDDDLIIFEGGASKYGFLLGLFKTRLFSEKLDLRMEYAHVRKWTYTHVSHVNTWEYRDLPFGFWLGPDADELYLRLNYLFTARTDLSANFDYVRKGEGNLQMPWEDEQGNKKPPFPSGTVEKSTGAWFDFHHEFSRFVFRARAGYRQIENRHNNLPEDFNNYFAHLVMSYNL
ncbi:MAG: capsule assembly Wzi family protein [candidate division Zixibacteria bacterium]|nr:capsule assembly Wzi family protein [candidate division Zixibacteria bacterium]